MESRNSPSIEYDQILSRFSVRRYLPDKYDHQRINEIKSLSSLGMVLRLNDVFSCNIFEYDLNKRTSGALGAFGRIFKAPYFLAPYVLGDTNSLVSLGYRTQQIVINLWRDGIGSCYIGCVHHQKRVKELLGLPSDAHIVSLVAFGTPALDQSKYFYQKVTQAIAQSKKRLELHELFLDDSFKKYNQLNEKNKKIIEAGRQAPSATNSQPWRFKIDDDYFGVLANRKPMGKIYDRNQNYLLHDVGICMANMHLAGEALGKKVEWEMLANKHESSEEQLVRIARYKIT